MSAERQISSIDVTRMPLYTGLGSIAVQLILNRIEGHFTVDYAASRQDIRDYVRQAHPLPEDAHYILHEGDEVIAAAHVKHRTPGGVTFVCQLAVHELYEHQGLARLMLQHTAMKAEELNDTRLSLYALSPTVFEHIGFIPRELGGKYMEAGLDDVLTSSARDQVMRLDRSLVERCMPADST